MMFHPSLKLSDLTPEIALERHQDALQAYQTAKLGGNSKELSRAWDRVVETWADYRDLVGDK